MEPSTVVAWVGNNTGGPLYKYVFVLNNQLKNNTNVCPRACFCLFNPAGGVAWEVAHLGRGGLLTNTGVSPDIPVIHVF